jgi:hypothetical protein
MKRVLAALALALLSVALIRAEEPPRDDARFERMLRRTAAAAQQLEFTHMLGQIVRRGADMGPGGGWFNPGEGRYTWKWLSARCGGKERISPKEFAGPPELFIWLDRDRDGFLTAADFDWSETTAFSRQMNQAQQWLRQRSAAGKLSKRDWEQLFEQLARGKDYLSVDDVRALLNPPPLPPSPAAKPGPGAGPPSKATLLQGLFTEEIGSIFEGPRLGQRAPDFTLATHDGKKLITLSSFFLHKPVALIFGSFT